MNSCIVIAELIGLLSGDISQESRVNFYNLDCDSGMYSAIVQNDKFVEIDVIKINKDLSYNIKIKG